MDVNDVKEVVVKKEPSDNPSGSPDENVSANHVTGAKSELPPSSTPGPLKYVSRRGRPPGGGYSMKSHPHYVRFSSLPLGTPVDLGRQLSSGSSSLTSHDLLKTSVSSSVDNLDIRRFGFPGFDNDKNSFRCDGCDVVFSSRDTYAMHMLLRAKNESCAALPISAISSNPENPTPREKFERELRQQTMMAALRNQASAMLSKTVAHSESLAALSRSAGIGRDDVSLSGGCGTDGSFCNSMFSLDAYGLYMDSHQYRRTLEEYGLRTSSSSGALEAPSEQLSCRECGEMFTGKDALAMHMMFHTRDDDKETSPSVSWADVRSVSSQKHESPWSSASSSPTQSAGHNMIRKRDHGAAAKKDTSKAEEGEITAERVAELKRMAIESSLRSSLKHSGTLRQSTRPKSVSQETHVTPSSGHSRPLSADDIRRFTTPEPKLHSDLRRSTLMSNDPPEGHVELKTEHKRRFSTTEHDSAFDIKRITADAKKRKNGYENIFYNLFYRSTRKGQSVNHIQADKEASVSDNHVSSASGPQDSDERSEGSSATEHESSIAKEEQNTDFSKLRTLPYLDAIMSQQAVLVPLDSTHSKDSCSDTGIDRKRSTDESQRTQSSAIDFSTHRRNNTKERSKQTNWFAPQINRDHASAENHGHKTGPQLPSETTGQSTRTDTRGNSLFCQYQNPNCNTASQPEDQGSRLGKRQPTVCRLGASAGGSHQENAPRNWVEEPANRVGEARYCPHCEILFLDVTLFHLHMGLHNVNNPWQCNTCGLVCTGRLDFNIHVLHY